MPHPQAQLAAIMCQAIRKSQLAIATLLMRRGTDIAQTYHSEDGVSSPLLLLISAAEVRLSVCHVNGSCCNAFRLSVWSVRLWYGFAFSSTKAK